MLGFNDNDFAVFPPIVLTQEEEYEIIREYQATGKTARVPLLFNRRLARGLWRRFYYDLRRDSDLAMDCVQETFLRAARKLDTFRFEARFSTWVYAFAPYVLLETLRQLGWLNPHPGGDHEPDHEPAPENGEQKTPGDGADQGRDREYPEDNKGKKNSDYDEDDWQAVPRDDQECSTTISPEDELAYKTILRALEECRFSIVSRDGITEDPTLSCIYDEWVEDMVLETGDPVREITEKCHCTASEVASVQKKLMNCMAGKIGEMPKKRTGKVLKKKQ